MSDSTLSRMIQQQMYTRERRGIFRSTEGYDTIAKSSGLDPSFIKKVLHPFCVYDAPAELAARGEKDAAAYPEARHLLHLDNGDVLVGRSVYQSADFTGLRSTFFTHNYLIPSNQHKELSADDYMSWLRASFEDSHNIENGTELAQLSSLPIQSAPTIKPSHRSILALLHINEQRFKQLLYAVMGAVGGKKKVYVALDVPIAHISESARQLLTVLYASLPYAYRKQLGFISFANEPVSRKSIHLTFVEKGSLRPGDRSIEKEYTFDFANERFMNVELDGTDQPYLDFAWDNLEQAERADSFFQFAEQMLADMGPERQIAAASYHELSVMFQIEDGNQALYEAHKAAVLRGLLDYMKPAGALVSKLRLNDLFLSRFDYEFDRVRQGQAPDAFIADAFKDYYGIDGKNTESKIVMFFIHTLNNAMKLDKQEAVASYYAAIESNSTLSKAFFDRLIADVRLAESLFIPYFEKKLKAAAGVKSLLQLIEQWGAVHSRLFVLQPFKSLVHKQLTDKLGRERHSMTAVSKALAQLRRLEGEARLGRQPSSNDAVDFYQELELIAYRGLLSELSLDRLTKEQLAEASFLSFKDQLQRWYGQLTDSRHKSTALTLTAVYNWFALPEPSAALFERLSPAEIDRAQQVGRRLLSGQLELGESSRLVLAFRSSSDLEQVDYVSLLDFLQQNAASKETVYRFLQWTEKHPDFMRARGFVPSYKSAIIGYFMKYDRDAFKKRSNRKQYFDKAGSALTAVYKQAQQELSSPLARFFSGSGKAKIITIATLGCLLIISGYMLTLSGKDEPKQEGAVLPGGETAASATVNPDALQQPDTWVYVEQTPAADGVEATTSLVFMFKNAAACTAFAPEKLIIKSANSVAVEYTSLKSTPACAAGTTSTDDKVGVSPNSELASAQPTPSADAPNEQAGYPSQVTVNLGTKVDIPANSMIQIGAVEYPLTDLSVVNQ